MAETHELRLKINAAAARAGAREFVSAIRSIQTAVEMLDRKSTVAFDGINSRSRTAGGGLTALAAHYNTARSANDRFAASVAKANTALQRQISLASQARSAASSSGGRGGAGAGQAADQQVSMQNRIRRAVDDSKLSVERLNVALMKVGGFQSINEVSAAYRRFQKEVGNAAGSTQQLDSAKTRLNSSLKAAQTSLVTLTAKAQDNARAERAAAAAAREKGNAERSAASAGREQAAAAKLQASEINKAASAQLAAASAMRQAEQETARLTNRLRAIGDTRGITALNQALISMKGNLATTGTSTLQVRQAMSQFGEATNRARIAITRADGAQASASRRASELAVQERRAADAARQLEANMRSAGGAANASSRAFRNATGNLRGLENAFSATFQAGSAFRAMIGSITIGTFTKGVFQAGDALDQFRITMEVASGSTQAAADDLIFINDIAARLGTNLAASRDAFSKFAVASDIAGVSGTQTREIFESVATAMSVLGRGAEDQKLAFLALEQMMSKGVISAEELRRQLGERLPGAVSMMAEAVGVSVGELQKMLKAGELLSNEVLPKFADVLNRRFGSQLHRTFNRAGSNLGRLQVEFQRFFESIAESGFLDELAIQFRDLTTAMRSEEVQDAARRIGEGFAEAAELFGKASLFIINNIEEIGRVATVIIGTLVVRQFALLAQSAAMGVQGMLAAVASFSALRAGATTAAASMGGYNAAAVTATASTTALGTGALTTATRLTRVGTAVAGIGRIFGALAGPVGLVFTALTLVPMALDMIGESAETAAFDYGDAMRHMETTTFRFLDRAREASELGIGEAIQAQADEILEAQQLLAQFRNDTSASGEADSAFASIMPGASESVRAVLNEVKELNNELRDPATSLQRALEVTEEMKAGFLAIRNAVPEDKIRRLEDALLPGAQLVQAIMEDMEALNGITAGQATALVEANAQYELANNNVRAIREGLDAVGTAVISEDVRTLMGSETRFSNLGEAVSELGRSLGAIPTVNPALVDSVDRLGAELDDGTITAAKFREEFARLQPEISATVAESERLNPAFQGFGQEAGFAAEEVDNMSGALVASENAAYAAEQGANAAASAAYNAADAGHAGAAGMRDLANAFAAISGAGAAAAAAIGVEIGKVERQIELRTMNFVDRQVGQALDRQGTLIEAQRGNIESAFTAAVDAARGTGEAGILTAAAQADRAAALAQLDDGIATYEERVRTLATTPLNNEGRPTTRRAGGGGGGRRRSSGSTSSERGQRETESAASAAERLAKAIETMNKALDDSLDSLEQENTSLMMLASGFTTSERAARILAEAQQNGVNIMDENTLAMVRQIEAAELLNEALTRLANDPVNDWMNSVPTWREAGQQIETGVLNHLSDSISNFIKTGEFSFEALGDAILGTVADIIADKAVKELATLLGGNTTGSGEGGFGLGGLFSNLFGNGGSAGDPADPFASGGSMGGEAAMQNAIITGSQQGAEAMRNAIATAGQQVSQGITTGGQTAASTMSTSVQTAGVSAGTQMSTQTMTGGTIAGTQMMTQTQTGGTIAAQQMQQGIMAGGSAAAQQMAAASSGGGGGGGFLGGGIGGMLLGAGIGILSSIFSKKKSQPSGPAEPVTPVGIRQFSEGTPNTSGIPAILHPNEAVIPLSGGRKVPVEMNDSMNSGNNGKTLVQNFNIQTPDADSFRKSQKQMAADAASSGRKALGDNG